jgi:hypothetical protein
MARPNCGTSELSTLALMAQSVETASLVPCLLTLPTGWEYESLDVNQTEAKIRIAHDRVGDHALAVTLRGHCTTDGAVRIPSDEVRTQRYERVDRIAPVYLGRRIYTFDGGCALYDFELATQQPSAFLNEATLMVSFVSRVDLRTEIADETDGVIENGP